LRQQLLDDLPLSIKRELRSQEMEAKKLNREDGDSG
jgi:hypothetical protein